VQQEASISQVIYEVHRKGHLASQEITLRNDLGEDYLAELESSLRKEGYKIRVREPFRMVYGDPDEEFRITIKPVVTVSVDLMDNLVIRTFPDESI
jgi:hypothetical protein